MKDLIQEELKRVARPDLKKLALADFLQHLILQSLYRLGVFKNLVFTGELDDDDLKAAYGGAYAFVSASLLEGFGLPGLEAMRFGLPLAVSNISVFNEIYGNGAIYFDPEKPESIAQCLNLLAQDRLYYMQVKKKALEWSKIFSWEKCAKETLEIYNNFLTS